MYPFSLWIGGDGFVTCSSTSPCKLCYLNFNQWDSTRWQDELNELCPTKESKEVAPFYRNLLSFIEIVWEFFHFYLLVDIPYLSILVVLRGPFIVCTYGVCPHGIYLQSPLWEHDRFSGSYKMPAMIWFSHDKKGIGRATLPRDGKVPIRAQYGRSSVFTMMLLKGWNAAWVK